MKLPIYLDYAATTPVDSIVAKKMAKYLTIDGIFGNPSSRTHCYGWQADEAIDIARNNIALLIRADFREIIFTSGATESNNLAIKGVALANKKKGKHIITCVTEHKTVLDSCLQMEQEGFTITRLIPSTEGIISTQQLKKSIQSNTVLVSIMHVNNETGIIQDIASLGKICQNNNILFHVDATQSVGKLPINLAILPVDLMSFSSHKIYGPKGVGVLFIRKKSQINIKAQIHGSNQEQSIRAGTLPVHQIVGMGEACYIAKQKMTSEISQITKFRNKLWSGLNQIGGVSINGNLQKGISTILNVSFSDIDRELLIMTLKDLAISTGSACNSAELELSYVLRAMKINSKNIRSSIRLSLGRFTTNEEIDYTINYINKYVLLLRKQKI